MKLLLIFMFISQASAQEVIECGNGSCNSSANIDEISKINFPDVSFLEARTSEDTINIIASNGEVPQSLKLDIDNSSTVGIDLSMQFNSTLNEKASPSSIIISNNLNSANINLNGRDGNSFQGLARECSDRILNNEYGSSVRSAYNSNRSSDPSLAPNECGVADLEVLQNQAHSCPTGYTSTTNLISSKRWRGFRQCNGNAARKICARKSLIVACEWPADKTIGCCDTSPQPKSATAWTCDVTKCSATSSGWYKKFSQRLWEDEFDAEMLNYPNVGAYCNAEYSRGPTGLFSTQEINDWRGSFSGSFRYENMNFTYDVATRVAYKVEVGIGSANFCSNTSACVNGGALNSFKPYLEVSGSALTWDTWASVDSYVSNYHTRASCRLKDGAYDGTLECFLSNGSGYSPTNTMRKTMGFSLRYRVSYVDEFGHKGTETKTIKLGHW